MEAESKKEVKDFYLLNCKPNKEDAEELAYFNRTTDKIMTYLHLKQSVSLPFKKELAR